MMLLPFVKAMLPAAARPSTRACVFGCNCLNEGMNAHAYCNPMA
jgi:hypothetical protein